MSEAPDVVLASSSPRRRKLLSQLGVRFVAVDADIDEGLLEGEQPDQYVRRLATRKAEQGRCIAGPGLPVLGADTVVVLSGRILGKPASRDEAAAMLRCLSGRRHEVLSAVAVATVDDRILVRLNRTAVWMGKLTPAWIRDYCSGSEPMDKAGAYAIQGLAGRHVERIEGSFSGVMGLPLFETAELLHFAGVLV